MKKHLLPFIIVFASFLALPSCGDRYLENSEADILNIISPEELGTGKPIVENTRVIIPRIISSTEDSANFENLLKSFAPKFELSSGATISDGGNEFDFSGSKKHVYTVTSENGKWKKEYEVYFLIILPFNNKEFHFELVKNNSQAAFPYNIFYEINEESAAAQDVWSSGNGGFMLTAYNKPADYYPTFSTLAGKAGKGVQLMTRSTGSLGAGFGMPIAAGNLFVGYFDITNATRKPLEATQFGILTTMNKPKTLELWCKYKAGAEYKDKNGNVLPVTDHPDVYAVWYEPEFDVEGNPIKLNGSNAKTAQNIVMIADLHPEQYDQIRVEDINTGEYQRIEIPFEERKPFDTVKQATGQYYFTIVFSSSAYGAAFEGAVGSAFCVDEVKIITE